MKCMEHLPVPPLPCLLSCSPWEGAGSWTELETVEQQWWDALQGGCELSGAVTQAAVSWCSPWAGEFRRAIMGLRGGSQSSGRAGEVSQRVQQWALQGSSKLCGAVEGLRALRGSWDRELHVASQGSGGQPRPRDPTHAQFCVLFAYRIQ